MADLNATGRYEVDPVTLAAIQKVFWADWASEPEAGRMIRQVWEQERYLLDPHTAVAWKAAAAYEAQTQERIPMVVLSTASPFKFADSVLRAIGDAGATADIDPLQLLERLSERTGWKIPTGLAGLAAKTMRHQAACRVEGMPDAVLRFAEQQSAVFGK